MRQADKWQEIIGPILQNTPYELVGVECTGGGKHAMVRVYIDKPGGITLDDIVQLTRQINVVLAVEEPIKSLYTLEVSSPGIERPLFSPEHFQQQVGQKVTLKLRQPFEERLNFKGILLKADDLSVELKVDQETFTFAYHDIEKARVNPDIKIGR